MREKRKEVVVSSVKLKYVYSANINKVAFAKEIVSNFLIVFDSVLA